VKYKYPETFSLNSAIVVSNIKSRDSTIKISLQYILTYLKKLAAWLSPKNYSIACPEFPLIV
jgi:hypothetical protein